MIPDVLPARVTTRSLILPKKYEMAAHSMSSADISIDRPFYSRVSLNKTLISTIAIDNHYHLSLLDGKAVIDVREFQRGVWWQAPAGSHGVWP